MSIEVRIPTILRPYTKDQKTVEAEGSTLSAVISDLDAKYAGLGERLLENVHPDIRRSDEQRNLYRAAVV